MIKETMTVYSIENPYGDYYIIKCKKIDGFEWEPGQHSIFTIEDRGIEGKNKRAFSIASTPSEEYMILGTRTGSEVSEFKKVLLNMKKGEQFEIKGPAGHFSLKEDTSPVVLFAGGVGITPIRAILKSIENSEDRDVVVIYATSDYYLFGEEIEAIAENNPKIMLYKTISPEETQEVIDKVAKTYGNMAYYYNSSSPRVVASVKEQLDGLGIQEDRMVDDIFMGYE
jgi:ferredoxin-NADP reductase